NGQVERAVPLQYLNEQFWHGSISISKGAAPERGIVYNYVLREPDGTLVQDWGTDRALKSTSFNGEEILFIDSWNPAGRYENAFYTTPFRHVLLKPNHAEASVPAPPNATHTFRVKAPLLTKDQTLCLLGSSAALARWNTAAPVLLQRVAGEDFLKAHLDLSQ